MKLLLTVFLFLSVVFLCSSLRRVDDTKPVSRNARIVGGQQARAGQFPWLAAIWKYTEDGRYFCAGSLYNEQWILTSAQCVIDAVRFTIQLGSNFLEGDDPYRVTVSATSYFTEPKFVSGSLRHDIGLIKLHMPVEFNDYIQPVVILSSIGPAYDGRIVEGVGWGQTSDDGTMANELHYVDMTILGHTACKNYYGEQLWPTMVCTEGNYNQGPCYGDIGSPLMTAAIVGNHTIQIALATFLSGNGCESTDPKGYTRIDSYRYWIRNTTRDN